MPVHTKNYTLEIEAGKPSKALRALAKSLQEVIDNTLPLLIPQIREEEMRKKINLLLQSHNEANPGEQLHNGGGASHLWISHQGGEWNNSRVIIIRFENLYI